MSKSKLAKARDDLLEYVEPAWTFCRQLVDRYTSEVDTELSGLHEAIAMHQQNERSFAIQAATHKEEIDALLKTNRSLHESRLRAEVEILQAQTAPTKLREDIEELKALVTKLGQDVQGLMNPVEIYDGTTEPAYTLRFIDPEQCKPKQCNCNCNSCKWKRHQETIKSTQVPGYGIGGTDCFVCGQFHGGLPCPTMTPMGNNYRG